MLIAIIINDSNAAFDVDNDDDSNKTDYKPNETLRQQ